MRRRALVALAAGAAVLGLAAARTEHYVLRRAMFAALRPVHLANCTMQRYGNTNDGGYVMCANLLDAVTVAYSYGIEGRDEWGCALATERDLPVHQYDCFDSRRPICARGQFFFHDECLGNARRVRQGRAFDSLASQFARNGDDGKRMVVKIDVEGAEWDALLATPNSVLARIDQLVVEFHGVGQPNFLAVLRNLDRTFHVVDLHFNNFACSEQVAPFSSQVYEVLFVNRRLGVVAAVQPSGTTPNPLHAVNNPMAADCQARRP